MIPDITGFSVDTPTRSDLVRSVGEPEGPLLQRSRYCAAGGVFSGRSQHHQGQSGHKPELDVENALYQQEPIMGFDSTSK